MTTEFGKRLKKAREFAGLTQVQLARDTATPLSTLASAESEGSGSSHAVLWADRCGIDPMWLTTGKGKMNPSKMEVIKSKTSEITIPQFNAAGSMGNGLVMRDQSGIIESWRVSPDWLTKNVKAHSSVSNLCIVTGFGDSMRPLFNSGDPLLVDIGVKSVEFDAIYFFRVGDEGFIKRLQRIPGDGIRAISENKGYDSWTIKPNMDFEVFGRVLKVWCSEDF